MNAVGWIIKTVMASTVVFTLLGGQSVYSEEKASEKLHRFSDRDGNSFRGFVTAYDDKKDIVSIRRLDGKTGEAKLSVFSGEDQKYIREWGMRNSFMSGINVVPTMNSERSEMIDNEKGTMKTLWDIHYELSLENTTSYGFTNMTLEYCVFYRQGTREKEGNIVYSEGVLYGKNPIEGIASSGKSSLKTDVIKLYREQGRGTSFGIVDSRAEFKVRGVWVRLTVKLPNGEVCVRDFRSSDDSFWKWVSQSHPVGLNVDTTPTKKPQTSVQSVSSQ
ncbi:MAG: hypothetical protein JXR23_09170 [Pontiellaceae bacterium]|nr:hypothetical protein [Pontiellaceae bacterium]